MIRYDTKCNGLLKQAVSITHNDSPNKTCIKFQFATMLDQPQAGNMARIRIMRSKQSSSAFLAPTLTINWCTIAQCCGVLSLVHTATRGGNNYLKANNPVTSLLSNVFPLSTEVTVIKTIKPVITPLILHL